MVLDDIQFTITRRLSENALFPKLSEISHDQSVQAILLGTYSINNRTLYITAKLISPVSRNTISAHSYKLCMDDNLLAMFGLQRRCHEQNNSLDPLQDLLLTKSSTDTNHSSQLMALVNIATIPADTQQALKKNRLIKFIDPQELKQVR